VKNALEERPDESLLTGKGNDRKWFEDMVESFNQTVIDYADKHARKK